MKSLDFEDFKKVCYLISSKDGLRSSSSCKAAVAKQEVYDKIIKIKSGMNLNRK
jgi:hypothetical protein